MLILVSWTQIIWARRALLAHVRLNFCGLHFHFRNKWRPPLTAAVAVGAGLSVSDSAELSIMIFEKLEPRPNLNFYI